MNTAVTVPPKQLPVEFWGFGNCHNPTHCSCVCTIQLCAASTTIHTPWKSRICCLTTHWMHQSCSYPFTKFYFFSNQSFECFNGFLSSVAQSFSLNQTNHKKFLLGLLGRIVVPLLVRERLHRNNVVSIQSQVLTNVHQALCDVVYGPKRLILFLTNTGFVNSDLQ
jgi:hypothetical protein